MLVLSMIFSIIPADSFKVQAAEQDTVQTTEDVDTKGYSYQYLMRKDQDSSNSVIAYAKYKKNQSLKRGGNLKFDYVYIEVATSGSLSAYLSKEIESLTAKDIEKEVEYAKNTDINWQPNFKTKWSVNGNVLDDADSNYLNTSTALSKNIDVYEKEAAFNIDFYNNSLSLGKSITMNVTSWISPVSEVTELDSIEKDCVGSQNSSVSVTYTVNLPKFKLNSSYPTNHKITIQKFLIEKYNAANGTEWSTVTNITAKEGTTQSYKFTAEKNKFSKYRISFYYAYNSYDKDLVYQSDYKYVTLNFVKYPFVENMSSKRKAVYSCVGENVSLDADVCLNRGYKPEYAWYKYNNVSNKYEAIENSDNAIYELKDIKSEDFADYKCVVKAYTGEGENKKYVDKTYSVMYQLINNKKFCINMTEGMTENLSQNIKTPVNSEVKLDTNIRVKSGYTAKYKWFEQEENNSIMKEIDGATDSYYKFIVGTEDFGKYKAEVTITNENDASDSETHKFTFSILEDAQIEAVYTREESAKKLYVKEGEDLSIVGTKYKCNPNYTLVYSWYKYKSVSDDDVPTQIEGANSNVLVLKNHKNDEETKYRYCVDAIRNGESEKNCGSKSNIYTVYNYGRDKKSKLSADYTTSNVFYKHTVKKFRWELVQNVKTKIVMTYLIHGF